MLTKNNYSVFITGTKEEGNLIKNELGNQIPNALDLTGELNLSELITFISKCDFLVAASTGPLHIAASLGINAIGIYPPIKPMHPARWQPVGVNSNVLCINKKCSLCRNSNECNCIQEISPEQVYKAIVNKRMFSLSSF